MIKHCDFFGNEIEIGDFVLRGILSNFVIHKVVGLRPSGIGLERAKSQRIWWRYNRTTRQREKVEITNPLWIKYGSFINLSKLEDIKAIDKLENYLNIKI